MSEGKADNGRAGGKASHEIGVSDHAIVRYIERIKGESLEPVRNEIRALLDSHADRHIPDHGYDDGFMFVIEHIAEQPTVVTILAPGFRPKRNRKWNTRTLIHVPAHKGEE